MPSSLRSRDAGPQSEAHIAHDVVMSNTSSLDKTGQDVQETKTPNGDNLSHHVDNLELEDIGRTRPRVFPYTRYLPYEIETPRQRTHDLDEMIKQLYISVTAGDFSPGAVHWTREIRGWLSLKFDLTTRQRVVLSKLYYELALAPGLDSGVAERFANMFMVLIKKKHYLRHTQDMILPWKPLFKELKAFVLPDAFASTNLYNRRNVRTLAKICGFAQHYFDPKESQAILDEVLPYFSMSNPEQAFAVIALLGLMFPCATPPAADGSGLAPQDYLPTFYHLWSMFNGSMIADNRFIDLISRVAHDSLKFDEIPWSPYGIFTEEQSSYMFTAFLRLVEVPVGQASSPYNHGTDIGAGLSILVDRDPRRHPTSHCVARYIIMSLSPACLESSNSVLHQLEAMIQAVETFFHPSNYGPWAKTLALIVYHLADYFVMRWNRERSGELTLPESRKLNNEIKRRFVLCLRDVVFMGIFAKSETAMNYSLSTLMSLAYLEPNLVLPGALQRIYPAMQGLVEVHRTVSSIRSLQMLSRVISHTKGFRCHLTTLLGLALPGIDANDLDKTMHSLAFIQSVCYNVPLHKLSAQRPADSESEEDSDDIGTGLAIEWVTGEMERFEREGALIKVDYQTELSDEQEERILRSSTAGFREFLSTFLGRVFTLLQNLPDTARIKSGSPEENIVNTLPATFSPLLATMSPELFDVALEQIATFITENVVHQARDAMAYICNSLVKVSPKKALGRLLPSLIANIHTEISDNGAGSTRTTGSEILPRDRALVWNISILSMCVVHVGSDVMHFKKELFDIAFFMQRNCRGIPLVHVSNFIHHLLLSLTVTYTTDYALFDAGTMAQPLTADCWGKPMNPKDLNIVWHVPNEEEINFAVELLEAQGGHALESLEALTGDNSPVKRDGTGKDWSDEVSRHLVLLRLITAGSSCLFRAEDCSGPADDDKDSDKVNGHADSSIHTESEKASILAGDDDEAISPAKNYPTGYPLRIGASQHRTVHQLRRRAGETLHRVHAFLLEHQQDDVTCFNALYTAYRSWFIDIGIERSAHVLDRLTRLFAADVHPFRLSGTRKEYPRPLLVKRANLYHFQRLRHKESPRQPTELDKTMLADLAVSCVSTYTDIRRNAQSAAEAAVKCIVGSKPLVIPILLDSFEQAITDGDVPRIKGAAYSLLMGSLVKPLSRYWKFTPTLIRLYLDMGDFDRPSIQKLFSATQLVVAEMCKATEKLVILDRQKVTAIWPADHDSPQISIAKTILDADAIAEPKQGKVVARSAMIEQCKAQLGLELIDTIKTLQWKRATRTAMLAHSLDCRFEKIATNAMLDLAVNGTIDQHPSLRVFYQSQLLTFFNIVEVRAVVEHKYENYLLDKTSPPGLTMIDVPADNPDWTDQFLRGFAKPETSYYVDVDHPGWLVWNHKGLQAFEADPTMLTYDKVESDTRATLGKSITREWFSAMFGFMKQEPRDNGEDHLRTSNAMVISAALELIFSGFTPVTFADVKELTQQTYGDGSDKHQHRATAEIMVAMLGLTDDCTIKVREEIWEFVFPIVRKIFEDGLNPENLTYWTSMVNSVLVNKDPRRYWPLVDWLASFRLDMSSNSAFKESSKISLLNLAIASLGWHFQLEQPILDDMLAHLDHPYKQVREVIGSTLATIFSTRYHESYKSVPALLQAQRESSSIGERPFRPSESYRKAMQEVLEKLEIWRNERPAGTQTPTSYTQGAKTVLAWIDGTLNGQDSAFLVDFLGERFIGEVLHMMDVKEDPEMQSQAYHVFRLLPNISFRRNEEEAFVAALIKIARTSTYWHQRLRVLINLQVVYFRQLFYMSTEQAQTMLDCVRDMLHDVQLEVRLGAAATISGMIRCSTIAFREKNIKLLQDQFVKMLNKSTLPKSRKAATGNSAPGTPTPEQNKMVLTRHAAVLGLGALVTAFPFMSPPPGWMPGVLATLATKASGDPGMVGKSVKTILSDFKKTRQDTWHVDVKVGLV